MRGSAIANAWSIIHRAAMGLVLALIGTATTAETGGGPVMKLAPEEGGPRRWQVTGNALPVRDGPAPDAGVIATAPPGTVFTNLGCLERDNQTWCEVRPLRGGKGGFAPAQALQPAEGPDGVTPMGIDDSRARARKRDFDAEERVRCAQEQGEALGTCAAAVARSGGGDATVVVTFPNGFARQLFFTHGAFMRASATMSGRRHRYGLAPRKPALHHPRR